MKTLWAMTPWYKKIIYWLYDLIVGNRKMVEKPICIGRDGVRYSCQVTFRGDTPECSQFPLIMVDIIETYKDKIQYAFNVWSF